MSVIIPHVRKNPEHMTELGDYVALYEPATLPERRTFMDFTVFAPYVGTVVRAIVAAAGGYVVSKGWTDPSSWDTWAGAAAVVVSGIWGMFTHAKNDIRVPSVAVKAK